jgi:hypothetical protein
MVVQPTSVIESKGPELDFEFIRPMKEGMLHHGACLFGDSTNGALGDAILMMSADTGKSEFLLGLSERILKFFRLENPVVSVVCLHLDSA